MRRRWPFMLATLPVLGGLAWLARLPPDPAADALPGIVRRTEIRITPEVGGRFVRFAIAPGEPVERGDLLAELANPDLVAALGEAEAALAAAAAERDRIRAGIRREEIEIAAEAVRTTEANRLLAQQYNARVSALAARAVNSQAQLDDSVATLARTTAELQQKRAQLQAAQRGPTPEERSLADARVALAEASVALARARLVKTRVFAPARGRLGTVVAEPGEVMTPGKPIATFQPDTPPWFAVTIREDQLHGLDIGTQAELRAAGMAAIPAIVTEMANPGEFATWRAARAVGDHDLNSFLLRLEPLDAGTRLDVGLTVRLPARR